MGNCLVTKLKVTVDNDALIKLDEFKLHVSSNSSSLPTFLLLDKEETSTPLIIRTIGNQNKIKYVNGGITEYTNRIEIAGSTTYVEQIDLANSGDYDIVINHKDVITNVNFRDEAGIITNDINMFNYLPKNTSIGVAGWQHLGSVSLLEVNSVVTACAFVDSNISGTLTEVSQKLPNLQTIYDSNTLIGTIEDLAGLKNLSRITLYGRTGVLETFIENHIEQGMDKVLYIYGATTLTFNNAPVSVNNLQININSSGVTVLNADDISQILGTYNGSTWTYNI